MSILVNQKFQDIEYGVLQNTENCFSCFSKIEYGTNVVGGVTRRSAAHLDRAVLIRWEIA